MSTQKPVLVVGGGPVGCVTALILSKAGVPVTILESEDDLIMDMRGSTFHPPTLDMLDDLGVTPQMIEQGLITPMLQYRDLDDGLIAEFDHGMLTDYTRHPYRLQCEQFKVTRIIVDMLDDYPDTNLLFNAKVVKIEQSDDGVTATFETPDGTQTIEGSYLVGCDGSRSTVRKSQDITFEGFTYPEHFVTVSTSLPVDSIIPDMGGVAYISHPDEWCALIHAPQFWRFLFPTSLDLSDEEVMKDDYLQMRMQRIAKSDTDYPIEHRTIYNVNQRVAETYRKGRVMLAGDSAHVNNPLGGMGLNGGVHDAVNLAPKLISILQENGDEALLDQYDRQRRPIAIEYVQQQTIRNKKMIEERDPAVRKKTYDELRAKAADKEQAIAVMLQTSMINAVRKSDALQ